MPTAAATKGRTRRSPALSALRRQEILQAAIALFGRKGFHATRAEDIAASAHLAKGTVYLYFRNKESIYVAAITQALRELQGEMERQSAGVLGFRERLCTAIRVRLEFWPSHEGTYRLLLTVGREPRLRKQTNEVVRNAQKSLLAIFNEGVEAGEIAPGEYTALAWATLDMLRGATERRMDKVSQTTPESDAAWIAQCVLRQVGLEM